MTKKAVALFLCFFLHYDALSCGSTADCISSIYKDSVAGDGGSSAFDGLTPSVGLGTTGNVQASGGSVAVSKLQAALKHAEKITSYTDKGNESFSKYNQAKTKEVTAIYGSADSTTKLARVKGLHCDLLSSSILRNTLYMETRMLSLQEALSAQIENEFKSGVKK